MKTTASSIMLALTLALASHAEKTAKPSTFPAGATPASPAAIDNWRAKRFGMFIHWGPVSLTEKEIGWSRGKETPIEKYDNLYKEFNPVKFNADEWVSIAKAAGMRYIVLTTKHHDGFCLWDTKLTDYNIMNTPFKRDVVKELAEACKKQGIAFGAYYSVCDWHHPDFPLTSPGGKTRREKSDIDSYNKYLLGQIEELVTKYGPLITIWNDVPQEFKGRGVNTINLVRKLQPDILINNRSGDGGDYDTPEQKIGKFQMDRPWESCMTVSAHNHWAWGGENDGVKSTAACLEMLVRGAGGDGNILLNVGPRPDGMIDPAQAARLKEIGGWLEKYGESIYDTRGGPWKPSEEIASTRKGNIVYLHLLKPTDTIKLPALPCKIKTASILGGGEVKTETTDGKQFIRLPKKYNPLETVIKLELDGSAMEIPAIQVPEIQAGQTSSSNMPPVSEARVKQLQDLRWGMFVCWSFSTFSGKEWTPGVTNIDLFSAKDCDTDQWVKAAKDAGMGYILFLTKHHDGFCLWDTQTTDRKVTNALLGRDVLAELKKSCDKYGIKLALYFSEGEWAWPGGAPGESWHSGHIGKNPEMKKAQLKELLTRYGPVEYIWFDHAVGNGGLSHSETVRWVKSFQPDCFVGFNSGPQEEADIRLGEEGHPAPLSDVTGAGFNSEHMSTANHHRLAEFTYPILPKHKGGAMWFYSLPKHDNLCLPADKLYADYLGAVKHGNIFSLDIGPDYNGKLRAIDMETLHRIGEMIRANAPMPAANDQPTK